MTTVLPRGDLVAAPPAQPQSRQPVALPRLVRLCDAGTLREVTETGEMLTGRGRIEGQPVAVMATEPSRQGGALSEEGATAAASIIRGAAVDGHAVVSVWDSGGARLDQGVRALNGVGRMFAAQVSASGMVPQISVALGSCAGGAAYGPGLSDVVIMSSAAKLFLTGPAVLRLATGESLTAEELGGPGVHARESGVAHAVADTEEQALGFARSLVGLLAEGVGGAGSGPGTATAAQPHLEQFLPSSWRRAYDVRPLIAALLDGAATSTDQRELSARWAPNIVTTIGRVAGRPVGVLANNPLRMGGCLTAEAADKGARFVRLCDALGVPLVVLVDVPGFLPGLKQEQGAVIRRGAKLVHAFADCRVPRFTVVLRKAYGGAFIAMNSKALGATRVLAWPGARLGVMAAESAVPVLHRRALEAVPEAERPEAARALVASLSRTEELEVALAEGAVDECVAPQHTRLRLAELLGDHPQARGRHRNIPL